MTDQGTQWSVVASEKRFGSIAPPNWPPLGASLDALLDRIRAGRGTSGN